MKPSAASSADSIAYLRERGVEIDLPEERAAGKKPQATIPGAPPFAFVHIPADSNTPVASLEATPAVGDVLKSLLAPCFASDEAMDPEVVMRETSARVAAAVIRYAGQNHLGRPIPETEVDDVVRASMWFPDYVAAVPRA